MAGDQNYGGVGVQFEGIDLTLTKTMEKITQSFGELFNSAKKTNASISTSTDYLRNLVANLSLNTLSVTTEAFNDVTNAIRKMMDNSFPETIRTYRADLEKLSEAGLITKETFDSLDKAISEIKPKVDLSGMEDLASFMKENRNKFKFDIGVEDSAVRNLEKIIATSKVKDGYAEKYKNILRYKDELLKTKEARPDFMPEKDYNNLINRLDNLQNKFHTLATKGPNKYTEGIKNATTKTVAFAKSAALAVANLFKSVINALPSVSEALIGLGKVGDLAKTLDTLSAQMSIVIDPAKVKEFDGGIQDMIRNFGVSGDEAKIVATEMNQFGVSVDKSVKMMPLMGKLIGIMGMDATQVARMFGQTSARLAIMPDKMNELVAEVYSLGKAQGFVNFLEDLPEVVDGVVDSFNRLGIMNAKVGKSAIQSTMALSAMYRKMGVDQKAAISAAKKVQEVTSQMAADVKRMQVGLDPENFDQMVDVAAELSRVTGKGANEAFNMVMQGALNPQKFQEQLMKITKGMNPQDLFRFSEVMRKSFGNEFANALQNPDMKKAAAEAAKLGKTAVKGSDAVGQMEDAMKKQKDTFAAQEKITAANKELLEAMAQLAAKGGIMSSWISQTDELISLQESVAKQDVFGKALTLAEAMKAGGASAVAFQLGADGLGAALAKLGTDLQQINKGTESLGVLGTALSSLGGVLGGLLSGFVGPLAKAIWGGIKSFKDWMFTGDKVTGELSKIGKMMQSLKGWFGSLFGSIKSGIGSVFEWIFSKLGSIGGAIKAGVGSLVEVVSSVFSGISKFLSPLIEGVEFMFKWFLKIAGVVGLIVETFKVAWDIGKILQDVMYLISPKAYDGMINFIDKIVNAIADMFGQSSTLMTILDKITSAFDYVVDKIQKAIGMLPSWMGGDEAKKPEPKKFPEQYVKPDAGKPQLDVNSVMTKQSPFTMVAPKVPEQKGFSKDVEKSLLDMTKKQAPFMMVQPKPDVKPKTDKPASQGYEPLAPHGADLVVSSPLMNQPEAPKLSGIANYKPTLKQKDKGNTLDDVVTALTDLRDLMKAGFGDMSEKAVNVFLQGDAKKFFTAYSQEGKNAMGLAGHGNAVTGSGGRS